MGSDQRSEPSWVTLRDGTQELDVLPLGDALQRDEAGMLPFADLQRAQQFLRRMAGDPANQAALRKLLRLSGSVQSHVKEINRIAIAALAMELFTGRLKVFSSERSAVKSGMRTGPVPPTSSGSAAPRGHG
ncbi:hypothetical protein ACFL59_04545, partial [Planctomycetota bacterium]